MTKNAVLLLAVNTSLVTSFLVAGCSDDASVTPVFNLDDAGTIDKDSGTMRDATMPLAEFAVSGTVQGLQGLGLELQITTPNGEVIAVAKPLVSDAGASEAGAGDAGVPAEPPVAFRFTKKLSQGSTYAVTVKTQPSNVTQTCSVMNASGTIQADVTNVAVVCQTNSYSVSGKITGLVAGTKITLKNNDSDTLSVDDMLAGYPSFTFATKIASGGSYQVLASSQPDPQLCKVSRGRGAITNANIVDVGVECKQGYKLGGSVSGIGKGGNIVLQNSNGDELTLSDADPSFPNFSMPVRAWQGDAYAVTIKTQASGRTCTVTNGAGTMPGADVSDIRVSCTCTVASKVLLLGEGSAETGRFEAALTAAGSTVTTVAAAPSYANIPPAADFDSVVVLIGDQFNEEMNAAGQTGIVAANASGTGILYSEWAGFHVENGRWQILAPTMVGRRTGGLDQQFVFTVVGAFAAHPIWTGLPASFTTVSRLGLSPLELINGGVALATCPECNQAAVIIKDRVARPGRIVHSAIAPGWSVGTINGDTNTTRMVTNAAKWASDCN
jgi:hypothetical protein